MPSPEGLPCRVPAPGRERLTIRRLLDRQNILTILTWVRKAGNPSLVERTIVKAVAANSKKQYKTNEVCKLFDVSRATLFRWEREGLISGPQRDWRNWRLYTALNIKEIKRMIRSRNAAM